MTTVQAGNQLSAVVEFRKTSTGVVTTGTATVQFVRYAAGTKLWLQSDASTWSASLYAFSMTLNAQNEWVYVLTVPTSATGHTCHWTATHSDSTLIPATGDFYATSVTETPGADIGSV